MLRLLGLFGLTFATTVGRRLRRGPLRPTWTFTFEWIVAFLKEDFRTNRDWPVARQRAYLEQRPVPRTFVARVTRRDDTIGGVPGVWFTPPDERCDGVLVFFHGGSYLYGSPGTHADLIARLALGAGVRVFAPAYRLAPEHPYPAALEDALAVLRGLAEGGTPTARTVVAGDSAGGNLALVAQLARRDAGEAQAAAAVLISPWLDLTSGSASAEANEPYDFGDRAMLVAQAKLFAGAVPLDDPRVSPLHARLAGLAPVLLVVGDAEVLHDECAAFARKAADEGVDLALEALRDLPHNGPMFAAYMPEARRGVERITGFVAARLAR